MKIYSTLLLAAGLFMASCSAKSDKNPEQESQALPVGVVELPVQDVEGESAYPVSIEGIVNSEVRAKIQGYITHVYVDEGAFVRKGQLLFKLETETLTEDAQAAKAKIEAAQVGVNQLKPLVEQKIVSPVQLQTAEAKLAQAKAAYKSITANIGYSNIVSPIDGYVGAINYRQGSLITPANALPITVVSNTNEVYAYFSMNEADYVDFLQHTPGKTLNEKIAHFPKVKLQMANGEIYQHDGTIHTVTAQIDPLTGSVSFRATFPNPEHLIADGSSGTILIPKTFKNAVVVPAVSTYEQQGKTYVFQLLADSTVTPVIIDVEQKAGNLYVIKSGVTEGIKIVAKDAGTLRDKMKVKPITESFDSVAAPIKPVFQ